jgi:transcriptional regulator with XRE-family HTH domain
MPLALSRFEGYSAGMATKRRRAAERSEGKPAAVSPPAAKRSQSSLSDYLSRQRSLADISLRKIIERSGIPGVVLRELEGGLKNPSQTLLNTLAGALRLSAETLYLQAGVLDPRDVDESDSVRELRRDPHLTEHQREMVVEVYKAFRRGNRSRDE